MTIKMILVIETTGGVHSQRAQVLEGFRVSTIDMSIRTARLNRTDESVVAHYSFPISFGGGVNGFILAPDMRRAAPLAAGAQLLIPFVLYIIYLQLLLRR